MHKEEGIAELHRLVRAVVLGELVLVEAVERFLQAVLDTAREFPELLYPIRRIKPLVAHQKLRNLIGSKHGPLYRTGNEVVPPVDAGKLHQEHHGDASKVHHLPGINGEFCHELGIHLGYQGCNAIDPVRHTLIEGVFKGAGHHSSVQLHLRGHAESLGPFVVQNHVFILNDLCNVHGIEF